MNRFTQSNHTDRHAFESDDPVSVEAFVYRMICPLASLLGPAGEPLPRTTWPEDFRSKSRQDNDNPELNTSVTPAVVEALMQRVSADTAASDARDQLLEILRVLHSGSRFDDLVPRVGQSFALMHQVAEVLEAQRDSEWLDDSQRALFDEVIHELLVAYTDPVTRAQVTFRLDRLARTRQVLVDISRLRGFGVDVDALGQAYSGAWRAGAHFDQPGASEAVLDWLGEIAGLMIDRRTLSDSAMSPEVRKAYLHLDNLCQRIEGIALEQALQMASRPESVYQPAATTASRMLRQHVAQLHRLAMLPQWLNQLNDLGPSPAYGINRRLNAVAEQLMASGPTGRLAAEELELLEHQVARYMTFPGEVLLRQGVEAAQDEVLGLPLEDARVLVGLITEQRSRWVSGWASGQEPAQAAQGISTLERLTRWLSYLRASEPSQAGRGVELLNRWAAWEVEPQAMERLVESIRQNLTTVFTLARAEQYDGLEDAMNQLESQEPAGFLIATLLYHWSGLFDQLPGGASGAMSQLMYPPTDDRWIDQWQDLAVVSRTINEASGSQLSKNRSVQRQLQRRCYRLMQQLDREPSSRPTIPLADRRTTR